ncbi:hypothetical protein K493DRAFT_342076 [Basidiobolus meristosporus CBS 931.73]|uniref:Uncharacterized protein n=1 Tax=Basidiobolus meristosporus CBS 931.73 TaxID=1314790 RepID=A0A1Y1XCQ4_9FUNG|nr:hypothetical protein K493DRAFT_342076 [Basidiobolus meristosporus CBS 931.73]|eukprot:ORX83154.1 hypothetical protein K493DRAFT_342076 [Basidiobolus meristosporus CBS 931.73]
MPVNDGVAVDSPVEQAEAIAQEHRRTRSNMSGTTRTSFPEPRRRGNKRTSRDAPSKAKEAYIELMKDHPDIKEHSSDHLYCGLCECEIRVRSPNDYLTVSRHIAREKHQLNFAKKLVSIASAGAKLVENTAMKQGTPNSYPSSPQEGPQIRVVLQHASKTLEDFDLPWRRAVLINTQDSTLEYLINLAYTKLQEDPQLTQITAVFLEDFQSFIYDDGDIKALKNNDTLVFKFEPITS